MIQNLFGAKCGPFHYESRGLDDARVKGLFFDLNYTELRAADKKERLDHGVEFLLEMLERKLEKRISKIRNPAFARSAPRKFDGIRVYSSVAQQIKDRVFGKERSDICVFRIGDLTKLGIQLTRPLIFSLTKQTKWVMRQVLDQAIKCGESRQVVPITVSIFVGKIENSTTGAYVCRVKGYFDQRIFFLVDLKFNKVSLFNPNLESVPLLQYLAKV